MLQGLALKGEVVQGFVDLPTDIAVQALAASGGARGVIAQPWLGGSKAGVDFYPIPPAYEPASCRAMWARVIRFSDVVAAPPVLDSSGL